MKAIEMIKTLFNGWLNLEQGGVIVMTPETDEQFIERYFGMNRIVEGKFEVGDYVYFYAPDGYKIADDYKPDVKITDRNGQYILLWRVE